MQPSVLVLNQYYPPDTAVTGRHAAAIAERMAADGLAVTAIVGQPSYDAEALDAPADEILNGVSVRRVPVGSLRGREQLPARVLGYLRYLWHAARAGRAARADVVLSFHNPPFLGLVAARIARHTGAKLIYVPQDIHPDILVATGWLKLPGPVVRLWDGLNRRIYRAASRLVVLGEGMRRTLLTKDVAAERVEVIPLWAEPALEPVEADPSRREELAPGAELVVLYAGNMGLMQPLEPVLDAARQLRDQGVAFVFAGSGVRRAAAQEQARDLPNVRFVPFQRGADYASLVAAADVCVVSLATGMELLSVPSRTFAFLAAARPVIALMEPDADIAALVTETGGGWHAADADALVTLLRELKEPERHREAGRRARAAYEARFTREGVTGRYSDLVREVVAA